MTNQTNASKVNDYHAHIYFSPSQNDAALALADEMQRVFGDEIQRGHWHIDPVGPHPRGSCQITFTNELFGQIVPWLITHRRGITLFVHANTGNDLRDHTEHVTWLGESERLNLEIFRDD